MPSEQIWSDSLAWALLCSVPNEEFVKQWGRSSPDTSGKASGSLDQLRRDLLNWARQDEEVRRWITRVWRETHSDVVAAADQAVIEGLTGSAVQFFDSFVHEDALLAFLTDEFDDGRELAKTYLSRLDDDSQHRALQTILGCLVGDNGETARRRIRLVILGGHPRDESRLGQRVFENSPFEVRWRAFEKKTGSGLVQKGVVSVLHDADALLIITGMAGHILTQFAKDYAQRNEIVWKCVEKATENQLKAALHEMFPELQVDWV
jgi:hypothetical protein